MYLDLLHVTEELLNQTATDVTMHTKPMGYLVQLQNIANALGMTSVRSGIEWKSVDDPAWD